jgi:hypothetical protein
MLGQNTKYIYITVVYTKSHDLKFNSIAGSTFWWGARAKNLAKPEFHEKSKITVSITGQACDCLISWVGI